MSVVKSERQALTDQIGEDAHNVLLLSPQMGPSSDDGCAELLTVDPPEEEDVLHLTFIHSPDDRMDAWRSRLGDAQPARRGFVTVDDAARSAAAAAGDVSPTPDLRVETVSDPGNLTELGIKVSGLLSEWEADGNRAVICFHSLTALLQYADLKRVYRFLHVLTGRVRAAEGLAHYHMDPAAHDDQTRNTLLTLFDAVAEWDGEDWTVDYR